MITIGLKIDLLLVQEGLFLKKIMAKDLSFQITVNHLNICKIYYFIIKTIGVEYELD